MSDSKKPTVSEVRAHYEGMVAKDMGAFYLLDLVERMGDGLGRFEGRFGWHGNGAKDRDIFYCENCRESHEDCTKIPHTESCPITEARALLKELKQ